MCQILDEYPRFVYMELVNIQYVTEKILLTCGTLLHGWSVALGVIESEVGGLR